MTEINQHTIGEGINFRSIQDSRFKTVRMSIHFMLPLEQDHAAANALLPFVMCRASKEYPDFTRLSRRLAELYGASLSAEVQKFGDVQVLSISMVSLADSYTLYHENLSKELTELLCSIVFDPPFDSNGLFSAEDFHQEQRQALETIDAEFNDKRTYAKQRCEQVMCANERYGIRRYGSRKAVATLQCGDVTNAWKRVIQNAKIEIMVLGNCNPQPVCDVFASAFAKLDRNTPDSCDTEIIKAAKECKEISEHMEVAQSKLVMGFRAGAQLDTPEETAARLMVTILGGTPHSKLFLNVREKLSLCYYCAARFNSIKDLIFIESGVETKNLADARKEILTQWQEICDGNITDAEIQSAKLSICNSYRTIGDYLGGLESWYLTQTFRPNIQTPEEAAEEINTVTKEEIVAAANRVTLDTVYQLIGNEGSVQ